MLPSSYNYNARDMRTIIELPEEQIAALKRLSERSKLPRAALVRQAVAEFLLQHQGESETEAFGVWKHRELDSLDYQRRLREEWPA